MCMCAAATIDSESQNTHSEMAQGFSKGSGHRRLHRGGRSMAFPAGRAGPCVPQILPGTRICQSPWQRNILSGIWTHPLAPWRALPLLLLSCLFWGPCPRCRHAKQQRPSDCPLPARSGDTEEGQAVPVRKEEEPWWAQALRQHWVLGLSCNWVPCLPCASTALSTLHGKGYLQLLSATQRWEQTKPLAQEGPGQLNLANWTTKFWEKDYGVWASFPLAHL